VAAFENKVEVHKLSTDMSPDYVFIKILNILKLHFENRKSYIERELAEALKPAEVKFYEQSYNFRQSKFGPHCLVNLANPIKTKKFAVLYRERIYFPGSEEDRAKLLAEPFKYASGETVPLDVKYAPRVFVQGLPKSGKSTVCKAFEAEAGLVHLKMKRVVEEFAEQDSAQAEKLRQRLRKEGSLLDDETLVRLLVKRLSFKDCVEKGFVLEDFPRTRKQAVLLAEAGVTPSTVLALRITNEHCYKRSQDMAKFANNRIVLSHKIDAWRQQVPLVLAFYQRFHHAVREIDASRSKWYVQDAAFAFVQESLNAQQQFAKNYFLKD
jgi:adenylate kinase family enzyme